jgi:hypothetical protein
MAHDCFFFGLIDRLSLRFHLITTSCALCSSKKRKLPEDA